MRKAWLRCSLTMVVAVFIGILSTTWGAQREPWLTSFNPKTSWHNVELVFKVDRSQEGVHLYQYLRDQNGNWRLDTKEGKFAGDVAMFHEGKFYLYTSNGDYLRVEERRTPIEASYLLTPSRLPRLVGSPELYKVSRFTTVMSRDAVEITNLVGKSKEIYQFDRATGLPLSFEDGITRWQLVTLNLDYQHRPGAFTIPTANKVEHAKEPGALEQPGTRAR